MGRMEERFWRADAQSCRLSQSVRFKNSSTFPMGECSGHSWSSIMSDIHSHCQRWRNERHSSWFPQQSSLQKSTGNCHLSVFVSAEPQIVHQLQRTSPWNLYCASHPRTFLLSLTSTFSQLFLKKCNQRAQTRALASHMCFKTDTEPSDAFDVFVYGYCNTANKYCIDPECVVLINYTACPHAHRLVFHKYF